MDIYKLTRTEAITINSGVTLTMGGGAAGAVISSSQYTIINNGNFVKGVPGTIETTNSTGFAVCSYGTMSMSTGIIKGGVFLQKDSVFNFSGGAILDKGINIVSYAALNMKNNRTYSCIQ